jgi:hypothetical protein
MIVHRCRRCSHPDIAHGPNDCTWGHCRRGCHDKPVRRGPSESIEPDDVWPGSSVGYFGETVRLCGCAECWSVYAKETA